MIGGNVSKVGMDSEVSLAKICDYLMVNNLINEESGVFNGEKPSNEGDYDDKR